MRVLDSQHVLHTVRHRQRRDGRHRCAPARLDCLRFLDGSRSGQGRRDAGGADAVVAHRRHRRLLISEHGHALQQRALAPRVAHFLVHDILLVKLLHRPLLRLDRVVSHAHCLVVDG